MATVASAGATSALYEVPQTRLAAGYEQNQNGAALGGGVSDARMAPFQYGTRDEENEHPNGAAEGVDQLMVRQADDGGVSMSGVSMIKSRLTRAGSTVSSEKRTEASQKREAVLQLLKNGVEVLKQVRPEARPFKHRNRTRAKIGVFK